MPGRSMQSRLLVVFASIADRLKHLMREMAPIVAYFFVAFIVIFLMFKLFVAQYSIEFTAFSKAAIAALILAKVIPLLDWAQSGYRFGKHRRAVVIGCKTVIYGLVVLVIGTGERILHSAREAHSFRAGFDRVLASANLDRFMGLVILITLTVGSYLVMQEISRAMGEGALLRLFFAPPLDDSQPRSLAK